MTCNVLMGTLDPTHSLTHVFLLLSCVQTLYNSSVRLYLCCVEQPDYLQLMKGQGLLVFGCVVVVVGFDVLNVKHGQA